MSRCSDKLEFVAVLARELPHHTPSVLAELAEKLMRVGAAQGRLALALCNDAGLDQEDYEIKLGRIRKRLSNLLDPLEIGYTTGGDARGFTVKLVFKSKRSNTWGDDGYGIPGS